MSGLVVVATGTSAAAVEVSTAPLPTTVSADALPTVQIDGVVWKQLIVGRTVYVGGKFTNARPAGSAAGTNLTPRANILAYNLDTGVLIPSFAPVLNNQVRDLAVSADGKTLYIAGAFTTVNGVTRNRVAAFDIATGALKPWAPNFNSYTTAIAVNGSTVYVGGVFTAVGGQSRPRVAAVDGTTGAVLPFVSQVADNQLNGIVVAPDGRSIVIAGNFTSVDGSDNPGYGLARLNATSGAMLPLPVNSEVRNATGSAAIGSLSTNGTYFYGTGWHYGTGGNSEGAFAADWSTGALVWLEDCHGDTYSAYSAGDVVYMASHKHYCGNSGGFPQTSPSWTYHHGTAVTNDVRGVNTPDIYGYPDHPGTPRPEILEWYPVFTIGNFTGASQGPWTVSGNSDYVIYGGEFLGVNNTPQQGLVRFAKRSIAPNKQGPVLKDTAFPLSAASFAGGQVRLSWTGNHDNDNATLEYRLYRTSTSNPPIYTQTVTAPFWKQPRLTFTDTGLAAGSTQRYRIMAVDEYGNQALSPWTTVTVSSASPSAYAQTVLDDSPSSFWRLGEDSGSIGFDWAGSADLTLGAGVTRGAAGATAADPNLASNFSGTTTGFGVTPISIDGPNTFSTEAWFKTISTSGGKIIGFGGSNAGNSDSYDRQVYMTNDGKIVFGVYPNAVSTVQSTASYNDGVWHQVVASMGSGGMQLFVDGKKVAQRADTTWGQAFSGYWRVGGDNLGGWPSQPSSAYFGGTIDDVAVYPNVLSAAQIRAHYSASGRVVDVPARPADAYGQAVYDADPDLFWRFDETLGTQLDDSGTQGHKGALSGAQTRVSTGALANVLTDRAVTFGPDAGNAYSLDQFNNPSVYTLEAWFSTSSNRGGKIIGLGSNQTGGSGNYDRHVYMQDNGQLVFGTYTGALNTITSPASYNNGQWHHVMATQDSSGMHLYVDGVQAGTNPQTAAQAYSGYWRVAGDTTWGSSSAYLAGSYDEVAVYSRALSLNDAIVHYALGVTGAAPNLSPVSVFQAQVAGRAVSVNGTASSDPDGTVASYSWDFGDGASATTATVDHTYVHPGTYAVILTVTDNAGATATSQQTVTVLNAAPVASFTSTKDLLNVSVDASASTDADGTISGYAWTFGDGGTATGATAQHSYAGAGTYSVTLTVTDDEGGTTSSTQDVTVAPNAAPVAAFTSVATALGVQFDASTSTDSDGTVASYAWDFSDGATATTKTPQHTFAAGGTYDVSLTVTDNRGATNTVVKSVTVVPNQAPVASFTPTVSNLSISVTGVGSTDVDGSLTGYAWTFGDGGTATGATVQHTYAAAGTYTVTLVVTDNLGSTGTTSQPITVTAPVVFAADAFARSSASGWGTSDIGGAYTLYGAASQYRVTGGAGVVQLNTAGAIARVQLRDVNAGDVDLSTQFSLGKIGSGGGTTVSLTSRGSGWGSLYRAKVLVRSVGTVNLSLSRLTTAETTLASVNVAGITLTPDAVLNVRFQNEGISPTVLRARVWLQGTAEPTTWQAVASDSTLELQDAGAVGIDTNLSSTATNAPVVLTFDNLAAGRIGAVNPVNQLPVAAFTPTVTNLSVAVNGSASSDPDGTIASYVWDFGDGSTGTGATTTHAYATAGTYSVKLTVTDNVGGTATVTQQVTATAFPVNQVPVAAFTATATNLSLAFNAAGSADPDGTIASYAWDFGDSTTGTGVIADHAYATSGTYTVTLTVTDNVGATGTTTQQVAATAAPVNQVPVAAFTPTVTDLSVSVSGIASSDPDGTISSYAWDFGDGGTATGATAGHVYAAPGTFPVKLTVTDNGGATGTITTQVTVTAPVVPPGEVVIANDTFARTLATGWGTSTLGGAWTNYGGASLYGVNNGVGLFKLNAAGSIARVQLGTVAATDVDVTTKFSLDKIGTGTGTYVSLTGRTASWSSLYRGKIWIRSTGALNLTLSRMATAETALASVNVADPVLAAGDVLNARLQLVGTYPTVLRLRVWKEGTTEPTTWQVTSSDATAELQDAGGVGLDTNLSGSVTNAPVVIAVQKFKVVAPTP